MARFIFKISGIFALLCGLATALPQAQFRTGVSKKSSQETNVPGNGAKSSQTQPLATVPSVKGDRQKANPAVTEHIAPNIVPVEQQAPPAVQVPLRPEQMPPEPPKVIYQNGLLSVEATNSTLGDILNVIRAKAGIQIDGLQGAPDRVATKLGPARVDTVLTTLLRGSRFDYLILGRVDQPNIVQKVILTASGSRSATATQSQQPQPGMVSARPVDDEEAAPDETVSIPPSSIQPIPQPGTQPPPGLPSGNGQLPGSGARISEQQLEDLKQRQQQQQQQQQLNQPNQQPSAPLKPRIPQ